MPSSPIIDSAHWIYYDTVRASSKEIHNKCFIQTCGCTIERYKGKNSNEKWKHSCCPTFEKISIIFKERRYRKYRMQVGAHGRKFCRIFFDGWTSTWNRQWNGKVFDIWKVANRLKKSSDYSLTSRLTSNPDEHKYGTDISYSITNNSLHVASNFPPGKVMHTSYRNTNLNVRFPMVVPGKKGNYDSNPIAHHPPFKLKHAQRANMSGTVHLDHMVDKRKTHYPLCGDISQTYVSSCRYHVNDLWRPYDNRSLCKWSKIFITTFPQCLSIVWGGGWLGELGKGFRQTASGG